MTVRVSGKIKNTVGFHLHAKGGDVDFCLCPLKRFQQQSRRKQSSFPKCTGKRSKRECWNAHTTDQFS